MSAAARQLILGIAALLGACLLIGAIYGRPVAGLAVGALLALVWQLWLMLKFERALRTGDFEDVRYNSGFWSHAFSLLKKQRQRGRKHKRRYRRLLHEVRNSTNAMPDGGIILNDRFEIVMCNAAAQELVGFKPRTDRGQRVDNILRDPTFVSYLRAGDYEQPIEIPSPMHDGSWLYLQIVPYGENQRLLLIRDVTERVRLTKMRRDFVANASHELRSPLTVINGYLDALAMDSEVPDDWERPLQQMQEQATRMRQIIEELIELSRLETAGSAPDDIDVDVPALLARARKAYLDRAEVPEIVVSSSSAAHVRGSATDIESVVTNLLSNAVRHTQPEGRVTLEWRDCEEGAELVVRDSGEGIAAEYLPRLTERFFRVDRGRARAEGGIGLGLAIVKYALSRHDAELLIDSAVGEGSTFTCRFPASRVVANDTLQSAAASGR
ncbi:MAG: phosphate regulon sensor histidine kinase PhoR [Pseudomonadota bacterium]